MKPKLKSDTLYVPSEDGTYFVSNQGSFTLKGKRTYQWVERLAPYLDGSRTLEEITHGLSSDKREMVFGLVGALLDKGFVKDVGDDLPHTLDAAEEHAYASEIAFIDYFCDSAAHRFQHFRQARILAVGSGLTATALVQANLHAGLRRVDVVTTGECATERGRHREYLEAAKERDPKQTLTEQTADDWAKNQASALATVKSFDAVIHVSDRPMNERARMLNRICVAEGIVFIQATVVDDFAWIGPLVTPNTEEGCWECAWRRLQTNRAEQPESYGFRDSPHSTVSEFLTAPTASIVANQLSFEIFKYFTGVEALETMGRMVKLDLETLQSRSHSFLPHPLCHSCRRAVKPTQETFLDTIRALEKGGELDQQAFSKQATVLIDEELGLLGSLDEHDFGQLPLRVSQVTISNPALLPEIGAHMDVSNVNLDFGAARRGATQRACEIYAASIVDRRRLQKVNIEEHGRLVAQADELLEGDGLGRIEEWAWSYDLNQGRARLVPAELVFPTLQGLAPSRETVPGLASGFSWAEAVSRGLMSWCNKLTIAELQAGDEEPFARVELATAPLTHDAVQYKRTLDIVGEDVAIYDVTGALRIPTFAFCLGNETIAYVSHVDALEALEAGLEQLVQAYQARINEQPQYAPSKVPNLPLARRGSQSLLPKGGSQREWINRQSLLQGALKDHGWHALVVPLDHDPAVVGALPFIVNVVLLKRG